ncbi:MAG: flagellar basal body rod protein FlgB [Epsilonproteobacteria bacterium]|jgi:flagellar basal-body rod protein FlgB|nr:flagellar basal body rod protein FlgB [Campylobacterota bacterium]
MSFAVSKSEKYLESAIYARSIRQDLISGNIANADTPYYRPRDINFEDALVKEINKEFSHHTPKLELAKTDPKMLDPMGDDPLKPTIFFRDGHLARNDGNSVDLDVEMTELSKNNVMYNATMEALKKDVAIFRAVLTASKNI